MELYYVILICDLAWSFISINIFYLTEVHDCS